MLLFHLFELRFPILKLSQNIGEFIDINDFRCIVKKFNISVKTDPGCHLLTNSLFEIL